MHTFLTHCVHAIGAPEIAVSFELERVNPEGPEVTRRQRSNQQDPRSPKRKSRAQVTSSVIRERQAPEHFKSPTLFSKHV